MMKRTILLASLGLLLSAPGSLAAAEEATVPSEEQVTPSATKGDQRQLQNIPGQGGRSFKLFAGSELRTPVVVDRDPANDIGMDWSVGGSAEIVPGLSGSVFLPWSQRFTAEEGDSPLRLRDMRLGLTWFMPFGIDKGPVGNLYTRQSLAVFLPVSRESRARDMRFALQASTRESVQLFSNLTFGGSFSARYFNHAFAQQAGLHGGMNTLWVNSLGWFLDYSFEVPLMPGYFSVGGTRDFSWQRKYNSQETFESASSSEGFWKQSFGAMAYLDYTPAPFVTVSMGYDHGVGFLKNGIPLFESLDTLWSRSFDRDRNHLFLNVTGRY